MCKRKYRCGQDKMNELKKKKKILIKKIKTGVKKI